MTDLPPSSPKPPTPKQLREERLAKNLRENLKKRKTAARKPKAMPPAG